jgi:hypothetical protein
LWPKEPMTSYFERLVDFVGAHPQLAFLAVFLLALSEAVPVIGTVVPGSYPHRCNQRARDDGRYHALGAARCRGARSNCRRRLLVLAPTSLPTADAQRLAAQSLPFLQLFNREASTAPRNRANVPAGTLAGEIAPGVAMLKRATRLTHRSPVILRHHAEGTPLVRQPLFGSV